MGSADSDLERRTEEVERSLKTRIAGEICPSQKLWRELGFASASALRTAVRQGRLTLQVFEMEGRRGLFCYRRVLARYLAQQSLSKPSQK